MKSGMLSKVPGLKEYTRGDKVKLPDRPVGMGAVIPKRYTYKSRLVLYWLNYLHSALEMRTSTGIDQYATIRIFPEDTADEVAQALDKLVAKVEELEADHEND